MCVGVLEQIGAWPVERAAAGVTSPDETLETRGPVDVALPWASVTKLVTAFAVLMAVDEEIISLDEPAGPEGVNVRHLLAHASGLPFDGRSPIAEPQSRRIYSNAGYEMLGEFVEQRTQIDLADFVGENVFEPLAMSGSRLDGSPAAGAEGPLVDLLAFGRELLRPTLISRDLHAEATSVVFDGLGGVLPGFGRQDSNDWGLGFEIRDAKSPHWTGERNSPDTFGHFGMSGSFLWVDPVASLACASLADRDFDDWATDVWPHLSDLVIDEYGAARAD
jgi:CubicO group peptidase (beta-lactamase class C family)